jgi:hypothetical protein
MPQRRKGSRKSQAAEAELVRQSIGRPPDRKEGHLKAAAPRAAAPEHAAVYFAATTMISTVNCGAASLASTVARAGVLPGDTQPSHTAFISPKVFMSVM